jgi:hypothetical protein
MRVYGSGKWLIGFLALVVGAAGVSVFAAKPTLTSLTASFRCAVGLACTTGDRLLADGLGAYVGNVQTTEGAFINANGGFWIHQVPGGDGRSVAIDLSVKTASNAACGLVPTTLVAATDVDLRINVEGTSGIESLPVGPTYVGFGILNYRDPNQANVIWTLRWQTGASQPGKVFVTRTSSTTWLITSSESLLQCTRQKGRNPGGDEGVYNLPFEITVTRP